MMGKLGTFRGELILNRRIPTYKNYYQSAFQIIDDCMDLVAAREELGKAPGADFHAGELTLPVLNLLVQSKDKRKVIELLKNRRNRGVFEELRKRFLGSEAFHLTKNEVRKYITQAEQNLATLENTIFKDGLLGLTHRIVERLDEVKR